MKIVYIVLLLGFYLISGQSKAQVYGCTDPLANNYNASATTNNGSCTYNSTSVSPTASYNLAAALDETSGLIRWNNQVWTHNDSQDLNLYALDTLNGSIVQTQPLSGVVNTDWEEISQDNDYLYIGDFGNNGNGNRTDLKILKISKSSVLAGSPFVETIYFSYSNQVNFNPTGGNNTDFDCEAFVVAADSIFLFTKQWVSNQTSVYSLSKTPGIHTANLKTTYNVQGLITGATSYLEENLIVLSGYSITLQPFIYLLYDYSGTNFFSGNKRKIGLNLAFHQVEGIATNNGLKYYISNELFNQFPFNVPQKLQVLNLNTYLANYINTNNLPANRNLNLALFLEGLFNGASMNMAQNSGGDQFSGTIADQITLELHNASFPYATVGGPYSVDLNTNGSASLTIPAALNASYYLVVKHRNSLETWSALPVSFAGSSVSYSFSTGVSQAFGSNLKATGGFYLIYGGDVNQDGSVDTGDMTPVNSEASQFSTGYLSADVNGDGIIDTADVTVVDNNGSIFISVAAP
ncbi:MAG: dockerin type I domain-containing protein [Lentimicrobium sp.]